MYIISVCLRILVSNTYCVVFLICLSSSCVPYVAGNRCGRDRMVVGFACEFEPRSWRDVLDTT
jgi:hypothetical protein